MKYLGNKSLWAGSLFLATALQLHGQTPKPNVVLILADDIGYGDLDWLGSETIKTPQVKELAENGMRFTNCHAAAATSTPSRFGLLTGMYPWRQEGTGIAPGDAAMIIHPEQYTMADMFKQAGYTTGAIGKWHLGLGDKKGKQNWNGEIKPGLKEIGFDHSFIMAATGDRVPCVYIENGRIVGLDPNDPVEVSYSSPFPGEALGSEHPELLRLHPAFGHDQAIVDGISRIGYMKGGKSALWHDEDIAGDITAQAEKFIRDNSEHPFFLYFGTNDIHVPRVPNEKFKGKSGMGPRGDAILSFDYSVGRVVHVLDSLKLRENTIIIITSDNGPILNDGYKDQALELLGEHKPGGNFRGSKYSIYEAGTRVPCIVNWKGIQNPHLSDALLSQVDLFSSLANLVGAKIPSGAAPDSENCLPVLEGKDGVGRSHLVEQSLDKTLSVVQGRWKYIEASKAPRILPQTQTELGNSPLEQLYDLKNDPSELNNQAGLKTRLVKKLREILKNERSKTHFTP